MLEIDELDSALALLTRPGRGGTATGVETSALTDGRLVDVIAGLEKLKRLACAVQAEATAALTASVRAADAARGVPAARRGRTVAPMVALARGVSETLGSRHVGASTALVHEMPRTHQALREGRIEEWTAHQLVAATACLSVEDRGRVDEALTKELTRPGQAGHRIAGAARALAQQLDPAAAVARARRAETERRVTLRPAPDAMTYLTALVPMKDGVRAKAAIDRAATAVLGSGDRAEGDERTHAQIGADLFVERLTGSNPVTEPAPVTMNLVMTDQTLLGGDAPAVVPGLGSVPAELALELFSGAVVEDQAWVRRLWLTTDRTRLVAMESQARLFPAGLADFITLRDQRCAAPFCGAPIRHLDHVVPHARGGPTTERNGQGLCVRHNQTKELPGFTVTRDHENAVTTWSTPTGQCYATTDPPPLGYPELPPDPSSSVPVMDGRGRSLPGGGADQAERSSGPLRVRAARASSSTVSTARSASLRNWVRATATPSGRTENTVVPGIPSAAAMEPGYSATTTG
ncbi:DUF222 domain-containing protein [Kineococcus gynurae]|uniref:DUF222 domain-containing protein n=1 Tax=Kineococcus gynurae TaxID=452979 RepID=A0ABV5LTT4_9ACTN